MRRSDGFKSCELASGPAATLCQWCETPFRARRGGGTPQRFCGPNCRTKFWSALRRWGEQAIATGVVTIPHVKNGIVAACTPPQDCESRVPLTGIKGGDIASTNAPLAFLVEVERDTIDWFVRLGFIAPDQDDDLVAIIGAFKRLGRAPSSSRVT